MSSAFSWKPYGVSSSTAAPPGIDSSSIRCTLIMVGALSPDPMITSRPVGVTTCSARVRLAGFVRAARLARSWLDARSASRRVGSGTDRREPRPLGQGQQIDGQRLRMLGMHVVIGTLKPSDL